jgi:hypothetical protein
MASPAKRKQQAAGARVPAATRKQWATNLAANQLRSFTDQVHTCLSAMTERQRHITMVSVACVIGGVPAVAAQFDALPPRKRKATKAKPTKQQGKSK